MGGLYYDNTKTFYRVFSDIDNLYITLYRSDVSEHSALIKQVAVLSSVQLCISDLGSTCLGFFPFFSHSSQMQYWKKSYGSSMKFLGHYYGQSWDLNSLLVMLSCDQDLNWCFLIILQWLRFFLHLQKFILLGIFYNLFFMCINKLSVVIGIFIVFSFV